MIASVALAAACGDETPSGTDVTHPGVEVVDTSLGAPEGTPLGETREELPEVAPECVPSAPQDTSCDGVDDDCDGVTDDDVAPRAVTCSEGSCETTAESTCVDGVAGDTCRAPTSVVDATCDRVDDDCDGSDDEDFEEVVTSCGRGACARAGRLRCEDGAVVDTCTAGVGAAADATCDGVDDDCDGSDDQDYESDLTFCGVGACAATGRSKCVAGRVEEGCEAGTAAETDATCDGVDDDCDGTDDEDYVPKAIDCGTGVCAGSGLTRCVAGIEGDGCGTAEPKDADCDDVDDDCDGETDEDYEARPTTCGRGACSAKGASACEDGHERDSCEAGAPAEDDATCDGIDDDCDGTDDEDYVVTTTTCGRGPCVRSGELRCREGKTVDTCAAGVGASADATCDDFDDDCSGAADEDYVAGVSSCGVGACVTAGTTACDQGAPVDVCVPTEPECGEAECGADGCGGSCGTCAPTGLVCLTSACGADGKCVNNIVAGRCFIGGQCWDAGQLDPAGSCGVCAPDLAADAWSTAPDLSACNDQNAATWADWCWDGVCRGFAERVEPTLVGSPMDWFDVGGPGVGGPGFLAAARTPTAGQAFFIHLTVYGAAEQGVTESLGSQWIPGRATPVAPGVFVEENRLWAWADGDWSGTGAAGTLQAAWPDAATTGYPRFDRLLRRDVGGVPHLWGTGRNATASDLVVRHCVGGATWTCTNEPVRADTVKAAFTAGLVTFGGVTRIVANDKISAPTLQRVLSYSGEPATWGFDATLDRPAGGKALSNVEAVGGRGGEPEWLVGTVSGGGLVVTRLSGWFDVAVPGLPAGVVWDDIRQWQGRVFILGRRSVGVDTVAILAFAPVDDQLSDAGRWRWKNVMTTADRRRVDALAADGERLVLLGSSPDAATERRTMWHFAAADAEGSADFDEGFASLDSDRWQALAQGSSGTPTWVVDDGALRGGGNHFDEETGANVVAKLGAVLWAPFVTFGDGRLAVAVRPSDDDGWGVQYGMADATHYYRVSFDRERAFARLVKVDGAVVTTLVEDLAFRPTLDFWHRVEVERDGGHHIVRLDDVVVLEADDATFSSGGVGLYAWSMSTVRFDDVRIYGR